ncbi:N-acyl homoserine lactonase family protein [Actinomycetospora termitidis]|uniref:N-acyl homoserine lactonase family protein n=1 Tax=Actinomycetospora termitidis TaxID=3053470 RepID=A0ABT7MIL9_9PSEU|nr:N-acyl homoserine lactonase family protein [Actinomycetospora sp. Odt1-22]MDL5160525.1 N-acyl homoserine lactonase family protein [Actinomycetospora sp. Odt1-22]
MTARRLWALDGARLTMDRAEMLDGVAPGPVTLVVPSFLIEHDHGLVLFDTGLAPEAAVDAQAAYGEIGRQIAFAPEKRVDRQLESFGFAPSQVTHVVVSHVHFDHTGGLRLFPRARFLLGEGDRAAVDDPEGSDLARAEDLAPVRESDWTFVEGDLDLFGDRSVVMLAMPGHTPGNTSLLVRFPGRTMLLTGDTAHLRSAVETPAPMGADTDPNAAVASLHRVRALAEEEHAEVWVAHDPDDWTHFCGPGRIV